MSRAARRAAAREATKGQPVHLVPVPREDWPAYPPGDSRPPLEVWRSRAFLVQVYAVAELGAELRITVQRSDRKAGISWDELLEVKAQIGRGDTPAVELYPPTSHLVDVANMRHLWTLAELPAWTWTPSPRARATTVERRRGR